MKHKEKNVLIGVIVFLLIVVVADASTSIGATWLYNASDGKIQLPWLKIVPEEEEED